MKHDLWLLFRETDAVFFGDTREGVTFLKTFGGLYKAQLVRHHTEACRIAILALEDGLLIDQIGGPRLDQPLRPASPPPRQAEAQLASFQTTGSPIWAERCY